jgi:hypothetical protein
LEAVAVVLLDCGVTCASCLHDVTNDIANNIAKNTAIPFLGDVNWDIIIVKLISADTVNLHKILYIKRNKISSDEGFTRKC